MLIDSESVVFHFNNVMYSQIDSGVMGSPLGTDFANIFIGFYEDQLFENVHRLTLYDMFALFRDDQQLVGFLDQHEILHPSFMFKIEKERERENDCFLPFPDILLQRSDKFLTSVYRKPYKCIS